MKQQGDRPTDVTGIRRSVKIKVDRHMRTNWHDGLERCLKRLEICHLPQQLSDIKSKLQAPRRLVYAYTWLEICLKQLEMYLTGLEICHSPLQPFDIYSKLQIDRKKPPPPGGFPIYYVPYSKTRRKRTPLEAPGTNSSRGSLFLWVLD